MSRYYAESEVDEDLEPGDWEDDPEGWALEMALQMALRTTAGFYSAVADVIKSAGTPWLSTDSDSWPEVGTLLRSDIDRVKVCYISGPIEAREGGSDVLVAIEVVESYSPEDSAEGIRALLWWSEITDCYGVEGVEA